MTKTTTIQKKPAAIEQDTQIPAPDTSVPTVVEPYTGRLPSAPRLFVASVVLLVRQWKLFLGIMLVYAILVLLLARGLGSAADLGAIKEDLQSAGTFGQVVTGTTLFTYLIGSGNTAGGAAGVYQLLLVLVASLAIIWSLRQVYTGAAIRIRDAFYQGMYPLVPFILVLGVICLQLIPFILGAFLFSTIQANMIAPNILEQLFWGALFFLMAIVSLYMITSSIFATYIVCLPNMRPIEALRSAHSLVSYRRWSILRKLLFLPFILFVLSAIVLIPLALFVKPVAPWVFFGLSVVALVVAHSYLYRLYRELL
jgi:hypothetical protein